MSKLKNAIELIDKGLSGENKGIPMGIHNLTEELCGVQPSTYTLIGGESGCVLGNTKIKVRKISEKTQYSILDFR